MLTKLKAKYGDLQNQIDTVKAEAETAERELSAEDYTKIKGLLDEQDAVKVQIETAERMADAEPEPSTAIPTPTIMPAGINNGIRSMGEFYQAVIAAGIKDRMGEKIGRFECGVVSDELADFQKSVKAAASGSNESVPSDGGFLVGTDYGSALLADAFETAQLPSLCSKMTMSAPSNKMALPAIDETSRATGSRYGGVQVYMAHEAAAVTATKPKFREIELALNKMMGLTYLTDELMQDAAMLEGWVRMMFAKEMGFKMDDLIMRGTGAGEPLGIINAGCLRSITKETGQLADTIVLENVEKAFTFCRDKANMVWLANEEILPQLMAMERAVGTGGAAVWIPQNSAAGAPNDTILGRAIKYVEQASALGDVGDLMAVDLSQYLFVDKGDIQTASSIHVNFTTDETALRFTYRLDGQPIPAAAKTPFKGAASATYSPFVAIAARA